MHFFCLSMQEKLPVAGPFNTKNAEYGDFEQKTIYSFITYAKIYKYLLTFLLLRSILSVSYTHLDVYKRQVLVQLLAKTPMGMVGACFVVQFFTDYIDRVICLFAVSYTHLDVYKRQV